MAMRQIMMGVVAMVVGSTAVAWAEVDAGAVSAEARKSLVLVEYTYRNENVSREMVGQGVVLNAEGVVLISDKLIPEALPKEWVKDLKVRVPGKGFAATPATFLGRTVSRLFAYVKTDKPIEASPLKVGKTADVRLGQSVFAVAYMNKQAGYTAYSGFSRVRSVMRFAYDTAFTQSFGLTRAMSPVYDLDSGALVGMTLPAVAEGMAMTIGNETVAVQLRDDEQSSLFLPWEECKETLAEIPNKPYEIKRPWLGVEGLTGLEEDVKTLYSIEQPAGVTVGSIIPGFSAEKAGLQARDIILTVDGKTFSETTVPDFMVFHFQRVLQKLKVGQEVKLGILREGKKMEVAMVVGASPKPGSEMAHVFHGKVGMTTRDLVFEDRYSRKLPTDQKGVMVALVKQGTPAGLGQTPLKSGFLITRVNDQDVENQTQFEETLKVALEKGESKEVVFRVIRQDGETQVCRIDLSK